MARIRDALIVLDADDGYASVRSRLEAAGARHVAVLIGPRSRRLRSVVAMRILRAYADEFGLDLSIVSGDGLVRQLGADLGLRVFPSIGALGRRRRLDAVLGRMPASLGWLVGRLGSLVAGLFILALAAAFFAVPFYLLVPQLVVRIVPVGQEIAERAELRADTSVRVPDAAARQVPARAVRVEVEGTERFEATGRREVPGAAAQGVVTFANRVREPVLIPQGTVLRSSAGGRYVTAGDVQVPEGLLATAQVRVVALQPGPKGDAGPLQINRIEGWLAERLAVTNERPISGGALRQVRVVEPTDLERARQTLLARLERQAANELLARRREGDLLPPETIRSSLLDEQYDRQVGDEADVFVARLRLGSTGTVFATQDIVTVVTEALRAQGANLMPGSLRFRTRAPEILRIGEQTVDFAVEYTGTAQAHVDVKGLEQALRGMSADDARAALEIRLALARRPQVEIRPEWASRAIRVQVIVESPPRSGAQ